jgi:two-component system, sensor histidine kinase and response regulator
LSGITGLNVAFGVRNLAGNVRTYVELLKNYAKTRQIEVLRLEELLNAGNFDEAKFFLHALKGSASTLGLNAISVQATEIEELVRDRKSDVGELVQRLLESLSALEKVLGNIDAVPAPTQSLVAPDTRAAEAILQSLGALLVKGDFNATSVLRENLGLLSVSCDSSDVARLEHEIGTIDFTRAEFTLRKMLEKLNNGDLA